MQLGQRMQLGSDAPSRIRTVARASAAEALAKIEVLIKHGDTVVPGISDVHALPQHRQTFWEA